MKERLDVLLVKRNLADSREKAKAIIMSGNVFVEGQREDKAGTTFPEEVNIEVRGHVLPYVSRGGPHRRPQCRSSGFYQRRLTMKLISWNVNGLRACVGKGFFDFFKS